MTSRGKNPARPKGAVVLRSPEEIRAARSPVAHRVISVMERLRRATVAEIAVHTGTPAGSLYYHVRKLASAGVLREAERRSTGGRREVVYEITGSEVVIDAQGSPAAFDEFKRSIGTRLRALERGFLAAIERVGTKRKGRGRNLSLHQHHARLGAKDLDELQRRIADLEAFLVERDSPRAKDFVHVTIAVHPVTQDESG